MIAGERGVIPFSELETIASHIRDIGWHIEFLIWPEHIVELEGRIDRLPCPFVIDHLAFIDASAGVEQPAFQALLRLAQSERCWLKLWLRTGSQLRARPTPICSRSPRKFAP